jgi:hypothetical protein
MTRARASSIMLLFCTSDGLQVSSILPITNQVSSVLDMMNQVSELLIVDVMSELLSSAEQDMCVVTLVWRDRLLSCRLGRNHHMSSS